MKFAYLNCCLPTELKWKALFLNPNLELFAYSSIEFRDRLFLGEGRGFNLNCELWELKDLFSLLKKYFNKLKLTNYKCFSLKQFNRNLPTYTPPLAETHTEIVCMVQGPHPRTVNGSRTVLCIRWFWSERVVWGNLEET